MNKIIVKAEFNNFDGTWCFREVVECPKHITLRHVYRETYLADSNKGYDKFYVWVDAMTVGNGIVNGHDYIQNRIVCESK